jgi:hypothetical protein
MALCRLGTNALRMGDPTLRRHRYFCCWRFATFEVPLHESAVRAEADVKRSPMKDEIDPKATSEAGEIV